MDPRLFYSLKDSLNTSRSDEPGNKKAAYQIRIGDKVSNINTDQLSSVEPDGDDFKDGFHAVFLENGQVYFGRLERISMQQFVRLTKIFYLKEENKNSDEFELVKLGEELHGPYDEMHIRVSAISFWERLREEGPVVKAIKSYYQHNG